MFDMHPLQTPPHTFRIATGQLDALAAWLQSEGYRAAAPLNDDELGRMLMGGEVIVLFCDGRVAARGDARDRAAYRLLMVCQES